MKKLLFVLLASIILIACGKDEKPAPIPDPQNPSIPAPNYSRSFIRFKVNGVFVELSGRPNGAYISHGTNGLGIVFDNDSTGANNKSFLLAYGQIAPFAINTPISFTRTIANGFSTIYFEGSNTYGMTEGVAAENTTITLTKIVDLGNDNSAVNGTFSAKLNNGITITDGEFFDDRTN